MAKKRQDRSGPLNDPEVVQQNAEIYGMGRGLFGNDQGEEDIDDQISNDWERKPDSETGLKLAEPPERDAGAVGDITALLNKRSRADQHPGAIVPWRQRDEALFNIIGEYGDRLNEAAPEVHDLCAALLCEVRRKHRFDALRTHLESVGVPNLPTWTEAQNARKMLDEYYVNALGGVGSGTQWSMYPWDRPGPFIPGGPAQHREVPGIIDFSIPRPSAKAPEREPTDPQQARINHYHATRGLASRMGNMRGNIPDVAQAQAARNESYGVNVSDPLQIQRNRRNAKEGVRQGNDDKARNAITRDGRQEAGRKNAARYTGDSSSNRAPEDKRQVKVELRRHDESMRLASGKYEDLSNSKVEMSESVPTVNGMPWFHGKVKRMSLGGVPVIHVAEGHVLCSGELPRPTMTEGYYVWDTRHPLSAYDMHIAFAQISEGMESERPWLKRKGEDFVLGIPNEGVIVERVNGELGFMTFDSQSGMHAAQDWMASRAPVVGSRRAMLEAVSYGYVRTGKSDLVLDRVIRKMNRLNMLDVLEDAVFDKGAEALYVLLNPTLEESDVQAVAQGIMQDYPEVRILGGPLDENVDWWVLYIPKPGEDFGPDLQSVFAPTVSRPLDVPMPDIIGKSIQQVLQ